MASPVIDNVYRTQYGAWGCLDGFSLIVRLHFRYNGNRTYQRDGLRKVLDPGLEEGEELLMFTTP